MSERPRKKVIEVALSLEAINVASAREKYVADVLALTTTEAGLRAPEPIKVIGALRERVQFLCATVR